MSRLLQALKNLEARSPKPAAGKGVLAHLADKYRSPSPDPPARRPGTGDRQPASPIVAERLDHPLAYLSAGVPTILLDTHAPTPSPVAERFGHVVEREFAPPTPARLPTLTPAPSPPAPLPTPPPPVAPPSEAASESVKKVESFKRTAPGNGQPAPPALPIIEPAPPIPARPPRQATLLERTVRRTLADPQQSEPFRQLADRLRRDLDQVAGRSLLLTGIGPASETHEVVLHAAAILAEAGEPILVIDADAAHRTLTRELELQVGTGLAELAREEEPENDPIRPIELGSLSVLPLGKSRLPDPATVANRLASLVQSLEEAYRLVIIDGGRTSQPVAAALARLCDATYFVVRLGDTDAVQAQSALRDFRAAGARVLGCIATA